MTRSRNEDSPFAPHRIRLFRFVGIPGAHWVKLSAEKMQPFIWKLWPKREHY